MKADPRQKLGPVVHADPITGEPKKRVRDGGASETPSARPAPVTDAPSEEMKLFRLQRHFEEGHGGYYAHGTFINNESYDELLIAHERHHGARCKLL